MGEYYYLVNDDKKEFCGCVNMSCGSLKTHYPSTKKFNKFMFDCVGCNIRIIIEHDMGDVYDEYTQIE